MRRRRVVTLAWVVTTACSAGNSVVVPPASSSEDAGGPAPAPVGAADASPPADAGADAGADAEPVLVDLGPRAGRAVFAISDVHGGYDRMVALLAAAQIIAPSPAAPSALTWTAGKAVLVVTGDLIDKGPQPLEVIEALRALEANAPTSGGRVVVLLGNHEAELFADPNNTKATGPDGIDQELAAQKVAPADFAAGLDPRGAWLRARPFGVRVGRVFFSHAGDTHGATFGSLATLLDAARQRGFGDPDIVGDTSILESREWYTSSGVVTAATAALDVDHIVFGHDPNALGKRGRIATAMGETLARIDCGMSPLVDDSTGCVLRIADDGGAEVAAEITASGDVRELWRTP